MDLAPVGFTVEAPNVLLRDQPVNQADGAVMKNLKTFSQFSDLDVIPSRETLDRQHRLVLLGSQTGCMRGFLAETKKLAQGVSELSQHDVIFLSNFVRCHNGRHQHTAANDKFQSPDSDAAPGRPRVARMSYRPALRESARHKGDGR
jgi:hypothetical protein